MRLGEDTAVVVIVLAHPGSQAKLPESIALQERGGRDLALTLRVLVEILLYTFLTPATKKWQLSRKRKF